MSRRPKRNFFNFTFVGIDELELFETPEKRQAALNEIGDEAANLRSWGFWLAILVLSSVTFVILRGLRWALPRLGLYGLWAELTTWVLAAAAFWIVLRWLHRWGSRNELREKLLAQGVPVCRACGYLLRGLPLSEGRCPECGRPFDDRVREILSNSSDTAGQDVNSRHS